MYTTHSLSLASTLLVVINRLYVMPGIWTEEGCIVPDNNGRKLWGIATVWLFDDQHGDTHPCQSPCGCPPEGLRNPHLSNGTTGEHTTNGSVLPPFDGLSGLVNRTLQLPANEFAGFLNFVGKGQRTATLIRRFTHLLCCVVARQPTFCVVTGHLMRPPFNHQNSGNSPPDGFTLLPYHSSPAVGFLTGPTHPGQLAIGGGPGGSFTLAGVRPAAPVPDAAPFPPDPPFGPLGPFAPGGNFHAGGLFPVTGALRPPIPAPHFPPQGPLVIEPPFYPAGTGVTFPPQGPVPPQGPFTPEGPFKPGGPVAPFPPEPPFQPGNPEIAIPPVGSLAPGGPLKPGGPGATFHPQGPVTPERPFPPLGPLTPEPPLKPGNPEIAFPPTGPFGPEGPSTPEGPFKPGGPGVPFPPEGPFGPVGPAGVFSPGAPYTGSGITGLTRPLTPSLSEGIATPAPPFSVQPITTLPAPSGPFVELVPVDFGETVSDGGEFYPPPGVEVPHGLHGNVAASSMTVSEEEREKENMNLNMDKQKSKKTTVTSTTAGVAADPGTVGSGVPVIYGPSGTMSATTSSVSEEDHEKESMIMKHDKNKSKIKTATTTTMAAGAGSGSPAIVNQPVSGGGSTTTSLSENENESMSLDLDKEKSKNKNVTTTTGYAAGLAQGVLGHAAGVDNPNPTTPISGSTTTSVSEQEHENLSMNKSTDKSKNKTVTTTTGGGVASTPPCVCGPGQMPVNAVQGGVTTSSTTVSEQENENENMNLNHDHEKTKNKTVTVVAGNLAFNQGPGGPHFDPSFGGPVPPFSGPGGSVIYPGHGDPVMFSGGPPGTPPGPPVGFVPPPPHYNGVGIPGFGIIPPARFNEPAGLQQGPPGGMITVSGVPVGVGAIKPPTEHHQPGLGSSLLSLFSGPALQPLFENVPIDLGDDQGGVLGHSLAQPAVHNDIPRPPLVAPRDPLLPTLARVPVDFGDGGAVPQTIIPVVRPVTQPLISNGIPSSADGDVYPATGTQLPGIRDPLLPPTNIPVDLWNSGQGSSLILGAGSVPIMAMPPTNVDPLFSQPEQQTAASAVDPGFLVVPKGNRNVLVNKFGGGVVVNSGGPVVGPRKLPRTCNQATGLKDPETTQLDIPGGVVDARNHYVVITGTRNLSRVASTPPIVPGQSGADPDPAPPGLDQERAVVSKGTGASLFSSGPDVQESPVVVTVPGSLSHEDQGGEARHQGPGTAGDGDKSLLVGGGAPPEASAMGIEQERPAAQVSEWSSTVGWASEALGAGNPGTLVSEEPGSWSGQVSPDPGNVPPTAGRSSMMRGGAVKPIERDYRSGGIPGLQAVLVGVNPPNPEVVGWPGREFVLF